MHVKVRLQDKKSPEGLRNMRAFLADPEVVIPTRDDIPRSPERQREVIVDRAMRGWEIDVEIAEERALCKQREACAGGIRYRLRGFRKDVAAEDPDAVIASIQEELDRLERERQQASSKRSSRKRRRGVEVAA